MFRPVMLFLACLAASPARAECPAEPSWQPLDFLEPGDRWVDLYWLNFNLPGHAIHYDGGTEHYEDDGRYRFVAGPQSWEAPRYVFYASGARCIDYPEGPRVDYYVLSGGRLTLINEQGERFVGLMTN
ncbi:MAG: hypothetical protein KDK12_08555 [Rhodobacteraceae bacterium]|nr:hypothetical protein [Paracoccaceae bacterium]